MQRTPRPPQDGILVVEHVFEGGPFDGRRMTGLASLVDMHVALSPPDGRPRLVAPAVRRARLGAYRLERMYDCPRSVERVHVYRWCPSRTAEEG